MRISIWRIGGAVLGILTLIAGAAAVRESAGRGGRVVDPGPVTDHCPTLECQPNLARAAADASSSD